MLRFIHVHVILLLLLFRSTFYGGGTVSGASSSSTRSNSRNRSSAGSARPEVAEYEAYAAAAPAHVAAAPRTSRSNSRNRSSVPDAPNLERRVRTRDMPTSMSVQEMVYRVSMDTNEGVDTNTEEQV